MSCVLPGYAFQEAIHVTMLTIAAPLFDRLGCSMHPYAPLKNLGSATCRINTEGVIWQVKQLFAGHKELILGFNTFLPKVRASSSVGCLRKRGKSADQRSRLQGYEITIADVEDEEDDKVWYCICPVCT